MTKQRSTKRALLLSALALLMCVSLLVGTTFAWFTDSVTSAGNKIEAGTLKIDLKLLDKQNGWVSIKNNPQPLFNYEKWEPGYTEVKLLQVVNEGSLALKWLAKFVSANELSDLANVIDVYVLPSETELSFPDKALTGYTKVGTVAEFVNSIESTTKGTLEAGKSAYLGLALKMREEAGNQYQTMNLGGEFDIKIVATQYTFEEDSFGKDYDEKAPLEFIPVTNQKELEAALESKEDNILLMNDIVVDETFSLEADANINGGGYTLYREGGTALMTLAGEPQVYTGVIINVKAGTKLTLENITIDGGAIWTGAINETLGRGTENAGVTATGALVSTEANATLILGEGAVLQNNCGANAVNLGTRTGGKLILDGGEIINNYSSSGAIWGGGEIVVNAGKINYNHGGLGGAIRVVTNIGTVLTMNGGEMNYNYSDATGGAVWAGTSRSNNVYVLNGGEMAYNHSAQTGGAMYAGYCETVKIGGTFKMHDNTCVSDIGSAIRFHDHATLVMTGGEVYNHDENAFFLYNNSATITGGSYVGDFGYSGGLDLTMGAADIDGVITYNLSTNHNTALLAQEFNAFKFKVNETDEHFVNFNFKPAAGYTYTEGDEAKLVCLNEGYSTYWDATSGTFRLQAN